MTAQSQTDGGAKTAGVLRRHSGMLFVVSFVVVLCVFPSALFLSFFGPELLNEWMNRVPFDSVAWKESLNTDDDTNPIRIRMVDDLLHRLIGMKREAVVSLLGAPPQTDCFHEYALVYWLGPECSCIPIDSEWLVIRLNNEGLVSEVRVADD